MVGYCIARPVNGISLNGDEYLLDSSENVILFPSVTLARSFMDGIMLTEHVDFEIKEYSNE